MTCHVSTGTTETQAPSVMFAFGLCTMYAVLKDSFLFYQSLFFSHKFRTSTWFCILLFFPLSLPLITCPLAAQRMSRLVLALHNEPQKRRQGGRHKQGHMLHLFPVTSIRMRAYDLTGCINYDRIQVSQISRKRV